NLAEHEGNFQTPTTGSLLSRSVVGFQIAAIILDAAVAYKQEKAAGISTSFFGTTTIIDPTNAAASLDKQTITVDGNWYNIRDGKYFKYGCVNDCEVDPSKLKGKDFEVVRNPA